MNAEKSRLIATFLVISCVLGSSASPVAASEGLVCYPDWAAASEIVERESLAPVSSLTAAARDAVNAQVVRTLLCKLSGAFVYRVVLKDRSGRLRTETVNARRPFGQNAKER